MFWRQKVDQDLKGHLDRAIDNTFRYKQAFRELVKGNLDSYLDLYYKRKKLAWVLTKKRDNHIAGNLLIAEDAIRNRYPWLTSEPLRLVEFIGGAHCPERYSDLPIKVYDLCDEETKIFDGLYDVEGKSLDDIKYDILRAATLELPHTRAEIEGAGQMNFEELSVLVKSLAEKYKELILKKD